MEWLILLAVLGLAAGLGGGYALGARNGSGARRVRELEAELAGARRELEDYRQEVVNQFKETARKFQTLNDSYTDLHQQLARSSSVLCAGVNGPLLAAPAGHHDLLSAEVRDGAAAPAGDAGEAPATDEASADEAAADEAAAPDVRPPVNEAVAAAPDVAAETRVGTPERTAAAAEVEDSEESDAGEPPTLRERVARPATPGADAPDIRVSEPVETAPAGAAPASGDAEGASVADEAAPDDDDGRQALRESDNRAAGRSGRG